MTPREPDRFEEKARELVDLFVTTGTHITAMRASLAAALRQAADEALERAAQGCTEEARHYATSAAGARATGEQEEASYLDHHTATWRDAESLCRALASPAAAPAAETVPETLPGDVEYEPSEPVAPAPSDLVRLLERIRATAKGHMEYFAGEIFSDANEALRILLASPLAPAKEPRK